MDHQSAEQLSGDTDAVRDDVKTKCFELVFDDDAAFHLVNFYEPETAEG